MDLIKQAFARIKQDILSLSQQISELKQQIAELKQQNNNNLNQLNTSKPCLTPLQHPTTTSFNPTTPLQIQTIPTQNQTDSTSLTDKPTQTPTMEQGLEPLKPLNLPFSIGNGGVPTDKPTNRQTNQHTNKSPILEQYSPTTTDLTILTDFERANKILNSLDNIKKEIRLKFKRLTSQEMLIFSTLYSLQEQNIEEITYKLIANNLNLSESSIRDYINKLTKKGIPILKIRRDNKKIILSISPDLRNIASLSTIIKLREL